MKLLHEIIVLSLLSSIYSVSADTKIGKQFKKVGNDIKKTANKAVSETKKGVEKIGSDTKKELEKTKVGKEIVKIGEEVVTVGKGIVEEIKDILTDLDKWATPDSRLRYDQTTFLMAHNAFASSSEKWIYAQQKWNIPEQLGHGVRGLMLDTYDFQNDIKLCHGKCSGVNKDMKIGSLKSLKSELEGIFDWLKKNPTEIVTIILEDHTDDFKKPNIDSVLKSIPGLTDIILSSTYWNPTAHNGQWPTLAKLQKDNKRLVIFAPSAHISLGEAKTENTNVSKHHGSPYIFPQWQYMFENQYSTVSIDQAKKERSESADAIKGTNKPPRQLFLLNFFPKVSQPLNMGEDLGPNNSPTKLKKVIKETRNANPEIKDKNPNFLALDYVNTGNATKVANSLNREAAEKISS